MSDLPVLIHIGYPKNASSWLQADIFGDYYRESNQKTSQLIGIDLAKLGYPE